jgi:hypothetical protein
MSRQGIGPASVRGRRSRPGRRARWSAVLAALLLTGAAPAGAQQFVTTGRDTLRGLDGIEVIVEDLPSTLVEAGVSTSGVRDDIVSRLRSAGITVYATQDDNPSPAKPYLYLLVQVLPLPGDAGHAAAVQLHVRQTLQSPATGSSVVNAMTWEVHTLLGVPPERLPLLADEIRSHVDEFVADWQAVRPR